MRFDILRTMCLMYIRVIRFFVDGRRSFYDRSGVKSEVFVPVPPFLSLGRYAGFVLIRSFEQWHCRVHFSL